MIKQIKVNSIGQSMVANYKCDKCKDTGWQLTLNGAYKKCECMELDYINRLWQNFGIDPNEAKKLNEYKPFDNITQKAKDKAIDYITHFNEIRSTRQNSFGLFGQPGAGKSHIVIAIGAALLNNNNHIPVVYMPYVEATREIKSSSMDNEYYNKLINRYSRARVLVIDDLFKDKMRNGELIKGATITEADMKAVYPIINYRYSNFLPTIFSTECTPQILHDYLDEALAGRVLESCGENITIFKGSKYDYRMKNFEKGDS